MNAEIEAKFINIDIKNIRERLKGIGAELEQPMRLMKRALIEEPHHREQHAFIRIRDEGDKTTLTFKRRTKPDSETTIDSTQELETTVGDFDTAVKIFAEAGWEYITFQESKRETWTLNGVEIVIDEWPWLNPMVEIEASTKEAVQKTADELGFDWNEAVFGSVDVVYHQEFPNRTCRGIIDVKEARFGDPVPVIFGERA